MTRVFVSPYASPTQWRTFYFAAELGDSGYCTVARGFCPLDDATTVTASENFRGMMKFLWESTVQTRDGYPIQFFELDLHVLPPLGLVYLLVKLPDTSRAVWTNEIEKLVLNAIAQMRGDDEVESFRSEPVTQQPDIPAIQDYLGIVPVGQQSKA